jgi:hypothetical protein
MDGAGCADQKKPSGSKGGVHKKRGSFSGHSSDGSTLTLVESYSDGFGTGSDRMLTGSNVMITASLVDVTNGMIYQISPNANRTGMMVTEMQSSDMPEEEEEMEIEAGEAGQERRAKKADDQFLFDDQSLFGAPSSPTLRGTAGRIHDNRALSDDLGGTLDVMVVWTAWAECRQSNKDQGCGLTAATEQNMRDLIDLAIEETNDAYTASGVLTSLRLVHAYRDETYVETDSSGTILRSLTYTSDGELDDVHTKRTQYGADLVVMILDMSGSCGRAWTRQGSAVSRGSMFSLVDYNCATGYYSFGHEIGHNLVSSALIAKIFPLADELTNLFMWNHA